MDNRPHTDTDQQHEPKIPVMVAALVCLAFMASTGLGFVFGLWLAGG